MVTTQYVGVRQISEDRWEAFIEKAGREHSLGVYESPEQAAMVRDMTAIAALGEDFAILNFPDLALEIMG